VIHGLGGGRDALPRGYLDGTHTCHYRLMPLLFARESDHVVETLCEVAAPNKIKRVLKEYTPYKRMIYENADKRCAICLIVTTAAQRTPNPQSHHIRRFVGNIGFLPIVPCFVSA